MDRCHKLTTTITISSTHKHSMQTKMKSNNRNQSCLQDRRRKRSGEPARARTVAVPTRKRIGSKRMSLSWSATALSLILAMQSNDSSTSTTCHAFAPSISSASSSTLAIDPTIGVSANSGHGNVSSISSKATHNSHFRTSIQFRHMDDDDSSLGSGPGSLSAFSHRSRSNRTTFGISSASAASSSSSISATGIASLDEAQIETSLYSMPMPWHTPIHSLNSYVDVVPGMPSWLRPNGVMADGKLSAFRAIMRDSDSYLSHLEAEQVISAIREASNGNLDMISGAVDFCLILVETMEMGVATLIAAVYHYCDAYDARRQSVINPTIFSHTDYWYKNNGNSHNSGSNCNGIHDNARAIKIGQDADQIIQDAAQIKRAETVASESLKSRPTASEAASICKMLLTETNDWRALAIRSAACLYRLRGIYEHFDAMNEDKKADGCSDQYAYEPKDIRVAREALDIHAPLASRLGMHRLKNEIEGAAFRILYRRQYDTVTELTHLNKHCNPEVENCVISSMKDGMRLVLDTVTDDIKVLLRKDPCFTKYVDTFKVTARVKEPYSLWRKMLKSKATGILDVPDALALRVVFDGKRLLRDEDKEVTSARERALCHYVQQTCMTKFKPLGDGRFKDYIANPKPNGYQSLHYTAVAEFEGDDWPFEIQVRSHEMHQVAEFGLAAHWDYKTQPINSDSGTDTHDDPHYAFKLDTSSDAYLRSVQEWHWQQAQARESWITDSLSYPLFERDAETSERLRARDEHLAPYLDALMKDRTNLAREHVFIFISCEEEIGTGSGPGQILQLPAGACILDAIREGERSLGFTSNRSIEEGIIINGSKTTVTQQLRNGDVITIPNEAAAISALP